MYVILLFAVMNGNAHFVEDNQKYELFQTPENVRKLFLGSGSQHSEESVVATHFYRENIRAEIEKWIQENGGVEGKNFIYRPDLPFLREPEKKVEVILNQTAEGVWLESQILSMLEHVREEVTLCLEEKGAKVLRLKQEPKSCSADSEKDLGWSRIYSEPQMACKISEGNVLLSEPFHHPFLSDERLFPFPNGKLISIATYRKYPTLKQIVFNGEVRNKKEHISACITYLMDAMKGCFYLHQQGFVHGDVKLGNIFVACESGEQFGMLFDLEGISFLQTKGDVWSTKEYAERSYYERKNSSIPVDSQWDVFAFGMSLLELCAPQLDFRDVMGRCKEQETLRKKEKALYQCIDEIWPPMLSKHLQSLIKSMLSGYRDQYRPSLERVILRLEEMKKEGRFFAQPSSSEAKFQLVA